MVGARELAYYFHGAWRLVRRDPGGLQHFSNTPEAFWRSFQVAIYVAPLHIVMVASLVADGTVRTGEFHLVLVKTLEYIIHLFLFPVVMLPLSDALRRRDRYLLFFCAYNWSALVRTGLVFAVFLFCRANGMTNAQVMTALFFTACLLLLYVWYLTREALNVTGAQAAAITFLGLLLDLALGTLTRDMVDIYYPDSG